MFRNSGGGKILPRAIAAPSGEAAQRWRSGPTAGAAKRREDKVRGLRAAPARDSPGAGGVSEQRWGRGLYESARHLLAVSG